MNEGPSILRPAVAELVQAVEPFRANRAINKALMNPAIMELAGTFAAKTRWPLRLWMVELMDGKHPQHVHVLADGIDQAMDKALDAYVSEQPGRESYIGRHSILAAEETKIRVWP